MFTRSLETQPHTEGPANLDDIRGRQTPSGLRARLVISFQSFIKRGEETGRTAQFTSKVKLIIMIPWPNLK